MRSCRLSPQNHKWVIESEKAQAQLNDHLEEILEDIPQVFPEMSMNGDRGLDDRWPSLFDWKNPDIVELWANKVPRTVSTKGRPLMKVIKDRNVRVQVALVLLNKGFGRWAKVDEVENPAAMVLNALKLRVGRERDYSVSELEGMVKAIEGLMKKWEKKDRPNLQDRAWESLEETRQGAQEALGGAEGSQGDEEGL